MFVSRETTGRLSAHNKRLLKNLRISNINKCIPSLIEYNCPTAIEHVFSDLTVLSNGKVHSMTTCIGDAIDHIPTKYQGILPIIKEQCVFSCTLKTGQIVLAIDSYFVILDMHGVRELSIIGSVMGLLAKIDEKGVGNSMFFAFDGIYPCFFDNDEYVAYTYEQVVYVSETRNPFSLHHSHISVNVPTCISYQNNCIIIGHRQMITVFDLNAPLLTEQA